MTPLRQGAFETHSPTRLPSSPPSNQGRRSGLLVHFIHRVQGDQTADDMAPENWNNWSASPSMPVTYRRRRLRHKGKYTEEGIRTSVYGLEQRVDAAASGGVSPIPTTLDLDGDFPPQPQRQSFHQKGERLIATRKR